MPILFSQLGPRSEYDRYIFWNPTYAQEVLIKRVFDRQIFNVGRYDSFLSFATNHRWQLNDYATVAEVIAAFAGE